MLNWAARYFPIVRALKRQLSESDTLLEVGSGPVGIGRFYRRSFIGCDVSFTSPPKAPMLPAIASGTTLPFQDQSFDALVASDVLEHVPPEHRAAVIRESLRVVRKVAVFGFPSGGAAEEYDAKLVGDYGRKRRALPEWLDEHLRYRPLPSIDLFRGLAPEWTVSSFDNENVIFHNWVMRQEMSRLGIYCFMILLAAMPGLAERLLRHADCEPFYRKIIVIRRR